MTKKNRKSSCGCCCCCCRSIRVVFDANGQCAALISMQIFRWRRRRLQWDCAMCTGTIRSYIINFFFFPFLRWGNSWLHFTFCADFWNEKKNAKQMNEDFASEAVSHRRRMSSSILFLPTTLYVWMGFIWTGFRGNVHRANAIFIALPPHLYLHNSRRQRIRRWSFVQLEANIVIIQ